MKLSPYAALIISAIFVLSESVGAQLFRWPTTDEIRRVTSGYDNNPDEGAWTDWQCGDNTYDGHRGTDIGTGRDDPIFAAADGRVQRRADGFGDGWLGNTDGGGFGNHVALYHEGSFNTIYGHLNAGSGIPMEGDSLVCGDKLGGGGTSGSSTGLHLHFETRTGVDPDRYYSGSPDDPFSGPCSGPVSFWTDQGDNYRPSLECASEYVGTRGGLSSPSAEEEILFTGKHLDVRAAEGTEVILYNPVGVVLAQWTMEGTKLNVPLDPVIHNQKGVFFILLARDALHPHVTRKISALGH
jgi:murein DD-endopeptidase MepM/ murein hydrolase activator NlpD